MNTTIKASLLVAALAIAVGCGGGGASGGAGTPAGQHVGFFVTSNAGPFAHVWVNVKQVSLTSASGNVTLLKSSAGKPVDLSSLNKAGKQLFAALGVGNIPQRSYSQVQVTVDNNVSVFPTGATHGTAGSFVGATGALKTITFPTNSTGTQPIIAKFDLSKWSMAGSQVTASAQDDSGSQVDSTSQEPEDFEGSVSNLSGTAPTLAFDISGDGNTTHVTTDATTTIANSDGSPNPVLTNNSRVDIVGTLDSTTLILAASSIRIHVGNSHQPNRLVGTVASATSDALVINISGCEGILPSNSTANIATTSTTTYLDGHGLSLTQAQFFTAAAVGTRIDAQGTYDQSSNTLTATTLSIRKEGEGGDGGSGGGGGNDQEAQVQGGVASVDVANSAIVMTISEYEGVLLSKGASLNIATTSSTVFNGVTLATITSGMNLEVRGTYANNVLTATEVKLNGDGHGGGG